MPGFEPEAVESGGVKRVFEAIYVKLLAARAELMHPAPEDMTPATRGLYELLYASDNSLTSPSHDAGLRSG